MKYDSFLENLYFGKLDETRINYQESSKEDPLVSGFLKKYKEAVKDYPAEKLEELQRVPDELIEKLKPTGFFGLYIPKAYGGVGMSLYQYLAAVKEIAKMDLALGILALAHLSIGMKAILLFGNEDQKIKYLTQAASGEMIFCYALTEPLIGSDAKNIDTHAELSEDGKYYILNGSKTFITNANYSGGLTVFAQMDAAKKGTLGAFIVETAWDGVSTGKDMEKMGLKASSTAFIQLKNVKVPKANLIGNRGDGFKIAMTVLNYGRLALGAASTGLMEISFQEMVKRAKSRIQFEKPIISYELIQEKIIHAYTENEAVWAMTNFTAGLLEKNPVANAAIESSHTKLYGTNRAWETLYDAMQTAGGAGFIKTMPYEKRMRDSRVATIFEGTTEIHSIYPPVALLRNLAKQIFTKKSPVQQFASIMSLRFQPSGWKIQTGDKLLRKAFQAAKVIALAYRKLFLSAVMKYGIKLPDKEFLLRRLTSISASLYIIMSLALKIRSLKDRNFPAENAEQALGYMLAKVRKTVKDNNFLKPDQIEKIHKKMMKKIEASPDQDGK